MRQSFTIAVLLVISVAAKGQHTYSYGNKVRAHNNSGHYQLPEMVVKKTRKIHRFHGYNWIGTKTVEKGRKTLFIVSMQKGNRFMNYTLNRRGEVLFKKSYTLRLPRGRSQRYARSDKRVVTYEYWSPGITYRAY